MSQQRYLPAIPPKPLFITTDFWKQMQKHQQYYNKAWMNLQGAIEKEKKERQS